MIESTRQPPLISICQPVKYRGTASGQATAGCTLAHLCCRKLCLCSTLWASPTKGTHPNMIDRGRQQDFVIRSGSSQSGTYFRSHPIRCLAPCPQYKRAAATIACFRDAVNSPVPSRSSQLVFTRGFVNTFKFGILYTHVTAARVPWQSNTRRDVQCHIGCWLFSSLVTCMHRFPTKGSIDSLGLLDLWCYPSCPGQCATVIEHLRALGFGSPAVPRSSQLGARLQPACMTVRG